jgi:hypothetical protein
MVDLIPIGLGEVFMAYGCFSLEVFHYTGTGGGATTTGDEEFASPIREGWGVCDEYIDKPKEYTNYPRRPWPLVGDHILVDSPSH